MDKNKKTLILLIASAILLLMFLVVNKPDSKSPSKNTNTPSKIEETVSDSGTNNKILAFDPNRVFDGKIKTLEVFINKKDSNSEELINAVNEFSYLNSLSGLAQQNLDKLSDIDLKLRDVIKNEIKLSAEKNKIKNLEQFNAYLNDYVKNGNINHLTILLTTFKNYENGTPTGINSVMEIPSKEWLTISKYNEADSIPKSPIRDVFEKGHLKINSTESETFTGISVEKSEIKKALDKKEIISGLEFNTNTQNLFYSIKMGLSGSDSKIHYIDIRNLQETILRSLELEKGNVNHKIKLTGTSEKDEYLTIKIENKKVFIDFFIKNNLGSNLPEKLAEKFENQNKNLIFSELKAISQVLPVERQKDLYDYDSYYTKYINGTDFNAFKHFMVENYGLSLFDYE